MQISTIQSTYPNATWFDSAHTGTESGSFSEPYNTLGEAGSNTPSGGVIAVKAGTHAVGSFSNLNGRTIVGTGSDAIMSASSYMTMTSDSTLIDVNIVSTGVNSLFRMGVAGSVFLFTIEGCNFSNTDTSCKGLFQGFNNAVGNKLSVSKTTFKLHTTPPVFNSSYYSGAVLEAWNYGWLMETTFTSCAFVLTGGTASNFFGYKRSNAPCTIKNCIFKGYSGTETLYFPGWSNGAFVDTNNCYYNTGHTGGTNNLFSDPLFVDVSTDDFRLRPTSPCIGAGTSS